MSPNPDQPAESVAVCDCYATEVVGPHEPSEHSHDCGYARSGRTDEVCGGCYGCISAQVAYHGYLRHNDGPMTPDVTILGPVTGSMPVDWPDAHIDGQENGPRPEPGAVATIGADRTSEPQEDQPTAQRVGCLTQDNE